MKRISTPKRSFTFTVGEDPTIYGEEDLVNHPNVHVFYANWLESEKSYEREWRNYELTNTDWMLVPDATYAGELLAGSQKLTDIMDYRTRLREYNLTTDDRPSRPEWFKG